MFDPCALRRKRREAVDGQNVHHLYPKSRFPDYYYEEWNLLIINICRHIAWHKLFGLRSLDEVISLLEDICYSGDQELYWEGDDKKIQCCSNSNWIKVFDQKDCSEALDLLRRVRRRNRMPVPQHIKEAA